MARQKELYLPSRDTVRALYTQSYRGTIEPSALSKAMTQNSKSSLPMERYTTRHTPSRLKGSFKPTALCSNSRERWLERLPLRGASMSWIRV